MLAQRRPSKTIERVSEPDPDGHTRAETLPECGGSRLLWKDRPTGPPVNERAREPPYQALGYPVCGVFVNKVVDTVPGQGTPSKAPASASSVSKSWYSASEGGSV
jgi:hypothetical protein